MIDELAGGLTAILIDNGECGRCDDILHTKFLAESLDESGLSCSHLAVEGVDAAGTHVLNKRFGSFADAVECKVDGHNLFVKASYTRA